LPAQLQRVAASTKAPRISSALMAVPIIDLFAGPGGLGEGFSREPTVEFKIAVSIEKDSMAHQTLRLRAAHRALSKDASTTKNTWALWDTILDKESWHDVFEKLQECGDKAIEHACSTAADEAVHLELHPNRRGNAAEAIRQRLAQHESAKHLPRNAVLIGGPPCQAYSVVGRARNKGIKDYKAEEDGRHFLYREYLNVIAEFEPAIFVMENVKGILTSRVQGKQIFHTIMADLKHPGQATGRRARLEYVLMPITPGRLSDDDVTPEDFIVEAENFGIPQARHRVIVLGIRKDIYEKVRSVPKLNPAPPPGVWDVISDLPALRPGVSFRGKDLKSWVDAFRSPLFTKAVSELRRSEDARAAKVATLMEKLKAKLLKRQADPGSGLDRVRNKTEGPKKLAAWYRDRKTDLLANHTSRSHMPSDLVRYLFVASFGRITKASPRLADFPRSLLPQHKNVDADKIDESIFKDRFRVQLADTYSTTVTSHIAKDGHAFIHPKPGQCRSLSVREAARLQTFPDSYVFLGNRTSQYTQVGNAVPPRLAYQIAAIVADVLLQAGLTSKKKL
jgi:DNA (cytosine-5)-methyltransferase 1